MACGSFEACQVRECHDLLLRMLLSSLGETKQKMKNTNDKHSEHSLSTSLPLEALSLSLSLSLSGSYRECVVDGGYF